MPQLALREWVDRPAALVADRLHARGRVAAADTASGTVILPFGRYFSARADMLTREGFKTIVPIDGVSPFGGVGDPDPDMQHFADSERVNERAKPRCARTWRYGWRRRMLSSWWWTTARR